MVGGGVRGEGAGIGPGTIAQVGAILMAFHPFLEEYRQDGEMTIETIVGRVDHGTTNGYPMRNFNKFIKEMFVRNLDMEDLKGEGNLNVVKNCCGLISQSIPRLNISRVCRVKCMTYWLMSGHGSSTVRPGGLRQVQGVS